MLQILARHSKVTLICCVALFAPGWPAADASPIAIGARRTGEALPAHDRYFVEFRARDGLTGFGHGYIVYGRLDAQGEVIESQLVGYSDGDNGAIHIYVPHATIGPLHKDFTDVPTAIYRRVLTTDQYRALNTKIRDIRRARPPFHMLFMNCTDFLGEIAESIGLHRPPVPMTPTPLVHWLRAFNGS